MKKRIAQRYVLLNNNRGEKQITQFKKLKERRGIYSN